MIRIRSLGVFPTQIPILLCLVTFSGCADGGSGGGAGGSETSSASSAESSSGQESSSAMAYQAPQQRYVPQSQFQYPPIDPDFPQIPRDGNGYLQLTPEYVQAREAFFQREGASAELRDVMRYGDQLLLDNERNAIESNRRIRGYLSY